MGSVSKRLGEKQCLNFPKYDGLLIEEHSKQTTPIQEDTERHDKTVKLDHELPGDLTVDSGVITSRDETPRKSPKTLSFSSESDKVIEIEVEKYQPKYYDVVVPQKFIAHITETPKPQKVHYKNVLYNSTPRYKNGGLTKEVLKAANLIKDVHCDLGCVWELSEVDKTFVRSPSCKSMDDKFVVNLFESRQSKRWKRKAICVPDDSAHPLIDAPRVAQPSEPESHKTVSKDQRSIIASRSVCSTYSHNVQLCVRFLVLISFAELFRTLAGTRAVG